MGQREIIVFLEQNPEKLFESKEIAAIMQSSLKPVQMALAKLRDAKMIDYVERERGFYYKHKGGVNES